MDKICTYLKEAPRPYHKVYEMGASIILNATPWAFVDESFRKRHLSGADNGIDAMSSDNTISYQMKCYTSSTITWKSVSTFVGLSMLLGAVPYIVCLPDTKIAKKLQGEITNGYIHVIRISYEEACESLHQIGILNTPPLPSEQPSAPRQRCCIML